jgi:hypothetical protein
MRKIFFILPLPVINLFAVSPFLHAWRMVITFTMQDRLNGAGKRVAQMWALAAEVRM